MKYKSLKNDILSTSSNEIESYGYRQYDMKRLNNILSCLDQYKKEVTVEENPESIKLL